MTIKFCSLSSGSSGNSLYISSGKTSILIDAGLSGKRIEKLLKEAGVSPDSIQAILVTHDHIDHIKGVGVLSRRYDIPIFANQLTWQAMNNRIGEVNLKNTREFCTGKAFSIGNLLIKPYPIPHDAADPVGFAVYKDNVKLAIANDLGCVTKDIIEEIKESNFLMLESNHDVEMLKVGHYPWHLKRRIMSNNGHLSNEDAGITLVKLAERMVKRVLLGHLSKENNYPLLALETVRGILTEEGVEVGREMNIDLSFRDKISKMYDITNQEVY